MENDKPINQKNQDINKFIGNTINIFKDNRDIILKLMFLYVMPFFVAAIVYNGIFRFYLFVNFNYYILHLPMYILFTLGTTMFFAVFGSFSAIYKINGAANITENKIKSLTKFVFIKVFKTTFIWISVVFIGLQLLYLPGIIAAFMFIFLPIIVIYRKFDFKDIVKLNFDVYKNKSVKELTGAFFILIFMTGIAFAAVFGFIYGIFSFIDGSFVSFVIEKIISRILYIFCGSFIYLSACFLYINNAVGSDIELNKSIFEVINNAQNKGKRRIKRKRRKKKIKNKDRFETNTKEKDRFKSDDGYNRFEDDYNRFDNTDKNVDH